MNHAEFLARIAAARHELDQLVGQLSPEQVVIPGVEGKWSVKDILAHITWFDREMIGMLLARALVGSPWWNLPQEERNQRIYELALQRPASQVLVESRNAFAELIELLQELTDADLNETGRFRDMPPDWRLIDVLSGNTFEHYEDHARSIRQFFQLS